MMHSVVSLLTSPSPALFPQFWPAIALPSLDRLGGIVAMLVFISVLIIAHEMGHFFVARAFGIKVQRFGFGLPFGPTLWSKKIGEVEYCVHACLFGGYVSFPDDDPDNNLPKDSSERFENASWIARFSVMIAGVTVNAILGWGILFLVFMNWGIPTGEAEKNVLIGQLIGQNSPAAVAGIQQGDEILAVGQKPLTAQTYENRVKQLKAMLGENKMKQTPLKVQRENKTVTLTVTPSDKGTIGIQLSARPKYEPVQSIAVGATKTTTYLIDVIVKQFQAFGQLFAGKMPLTELAGPIRIVDQGATLINQNGIQVGLMLTAIISIILAVMNLLPIPALDGGHIFFLLIELVKGSPVKQELRERVTQVGFVGMLALIGFILFNDINNTLLR
ncbi:MAG: RIP metalloprotease RseP [Cyanobacteria bacterium P01_H01_bin.74]